MFTGIIEAQGKVVSSEKGRLKLRLPARFGKLKKGSSLAVHGTCLSVVEQKGRLATFHVVPETLQRTVLGSLKKSESVHLERSLPWGGRVEGHFVLGHVDGVGEVMQVTKKGQQTSLLIKPPKAISKWIWEKGSIAVNGVSLTVGKLEKGAFWVHLIPLTFQETTLGSLKKGSLLNLEADTLAKRKRR